MNTKRLWGSIFLCIALTCVTAPLAFTPGCQSPPERQAFNVAVGGRIGVEVAVTEFKVQVRAGKVSKDNFRKAKDALTAWQDADLAYLEALEAIVSIPPATVPPTPGAATPPNTEALKRIAQAAYRGLYNILVIYVPNMDPNPPTH